MKKAYFTGAKTNAKLPQEPEKVLIHGFVANVAAAGDDQVVLLENGTDMLKLNMKAGNSVSFESNRGIEWKDFGVTQGSGASITIFYKLRA